MCAEPERRVVHVFESPPEGEVSFDLPGSYRRRLLKCAGDRHVVSAHSMDMSGLYSGGYADKTYGADGMRRTFERVLSLPAGRSDNAGRVDRVVSFLAQSGLSAPRLLDVGSGTGVFPNRVKAAGWDVTALDPDARAVAHLREVAGVPAVQGDFMERDLGDLGTFDVVTFNKVLEHAFDPVAMLTRSIPLLESTGIVYLEVPDAEGAAGDPDCYGREEFFIDHHHVFTEESTRLLAQASGLRVLHVERLQEPSTKYTIRLFGRPL